ncbi:MAG TPA: OmpA family protein [Desulfuromonadales bacterium]|nr:OmpA family protein [Desulfuromonadales bacterium]
MKVLQLCILTISAAYLAGCASVAPKELVDARSAYQTASAGPAQELAPADLHKAQLALNEAEQSFHKDSDSTKTKDLSYVAQRKSEQAGALGAIAAAKSTKERANADFQKQQAAIVEQGKKDLRESEKQSAVTQAELEKQAALKTAKDTADAELKASEQRTAAGQQAAAVQAERARQASEQQAAAEQRTAAAQTELARQAEVKAAKERTDAESQRQQALIEQGKRDVVEAEKRAAVTRAELDKQAALNRAKASADAELKASEQRTAAAMAELAAIASLKEEERGLVLTLSGSILFRSAEASLMPAAQVKLDQVTKALLTIHPRSLVVEGHTDSQGSDAYNQALSQRRADAVRDYLVQKGYPANQIQARGQGEGSPIAKNSSAEGRANNRRVEIVIQREVQTSKK